jgi:resorcinol 4-hydroxylase (FADH2)
MSTTLVSTAGVQQNDLYSAANLLARARALAPKLRERSLATNKAGRIPEETIADLWDHKLNYLLRPKKFGGPAMRPDEAFAAGFELGRGDGSAAWVWSVMLIHDLFVAHFPEEFQHEYWGKDRTLSASSFLPNGKPTPANGGVRVSGKWSFCSGVDNAQWMILGAMFGMVGNPPRPDVRFMVLPISDCKIIDDWRVLGLQGTGSKSIVVENVFVPDSHIVSGEAMATGQAPGGEVHSRNIYRAPTWAVFPFCLSSSAAGIARGGLEQFLERIKERAAAFDMQQLSQMQHIRMRISEAGALIDAAALLYQRSARETFDKIESGEPLSIEHRLRSRRDQAYSVVMATRAMELLFKSTGGKGLYDNDPVQRAYRDLHAMGAHIAVTWDLPASSYGSVVLGGPPTDYLF